MIETDIEFGVAADTTIKARGAHSATGIVGSLPRSRFGLVWEREALGCQQWKRLTQRYDVKGVAIKARGAQSATGICGESSSLTLRVGMGA